MPITDENTKKGFNNLARVGEFLYEISDDNAEQTKYFMAKSALDEFSDAFESLDLDLQTREGIRKLIKYLGNKIEKRKRQSGGEFSED